MAFYCVMMMKTALELAQEDPVYQDTATKFFEHFLRISSAMLNRSEKAAACGMKKINSFMTSFTCLKGRSSRSKCDRYLPLFAVETMEPEIYKKAPIFERRLEWFFNLGGSTIRLSVACCVTVANAHQVPPSLSDRDEYQL